MYIVYIIILITSLFLTFYGNLSPWLGLPLLLFAVGGIALDLKNYFKTNVNCNQLRKDKKLKWIGKFSLVEGFNLVPNQNVLFGLTRRDSLLLISAQQENQIEIQNIEGMLEIKGKDLLKLSDDRLRLFLNRESTAPVFGNIRNLIQDASNLKNQKVIIISLKPRTEEFHNKRMNNDLIILILAFDCVNFQKFTQSPEIRNKIYIYNKKIEKRNDQKDINFDTNTQKIIK